MNDLIPISYQCAYCGEQNETLVDPTGGIRQQYTEDCTVCCRPNVLRVSISSDGDATVYTESED